MKKYLFLALALIVVVSVFYLNQASAQTTPTLTLGTASGTAGSVVTVPITMAGNSTITGANFDVVYDPAKLTLGTTAIAKSAALTNAGFSLMSSKPSSGILRVVIINMETPTVIPNGVIANISFTINSSAVSGSTPVTFTAVAASDASANSVTLSPANGSVTITASQATYNMTNFTKLVADWGKPGDAVSNVNSDAIVDTRDLGIMMSYWSTT